MANRNQKIIRTSLTGIGANLLLAGFKFAIGTAANSVSICADALNNTTDALSFIITIVGVRLSEKRPDRKHPFGYGRIEYFSSLIIGMIIAYAGLAPLRVAVKRIVRPEPNEYTVWTLSVMAAAVAVKIVIGLYTLRHGKRLESGALKASGKDALNDARAAVREYPGHKVSVRANHCCE